ncbi:MAG: hypothetical protein QG592_1561, partial [Pseudomonadota bacterium]|nr:hypothetical protein [Pseudomonadota bacterium]
MAHLELQDIKQSYGKNLVVDGVSFQINT